jgi:hypothetical protein
MQGFDRAGMAFSLSSRPTSERKPTMEDTTRQAKWSDRQTSINGDYRELNCLSRSKIN